jgi:hypothetical protein
MSIDVASEAPCHVDHLLDAYSSYFLRIPIMFLSHILVTYPDKACQLAHQAVALRTFDATSLPKFKRMSSVMSSEPSAMSSLVKNII